jgi:peptide-methionine (R)-S-oxide reductase
MQPPLFQLTTEQWQKKLSPEEFKVLRLGKTEKSFTKQFITNPKALYSCAGCDQVLFTYLFEINK